MKTKLLWKRIAIFFGILLIGGLPVSAQTISVDFTNMNPHIGQKLEARLMDKKNLQEVDRTMISSITSATFSVTLDGVVGGSYWIEFYADLNGNGVYDAPPVDHAWRVNADVILTGTNNVPFAHNTSFDEIGWKHELTLAFSDMGPHLGQMLEARLLNVNQNMKEVSRQNITSISATSFNLTFPGITVGNSYYLDFYADLNGNGVYDVPPTDHAWRMVLNDLMGDSMVSFSHNTNFTDIDWKYLLTIDLMSMTPHLNQRLELRVVNSENETEIGRIARTIDLVDLNVLMPGVEAGVEYTVDFYADLNGNGLYDAPPSDHAWRESTTSLTGNTTISFTHNVNFTDVDWVYLLSFYAEGMTPHLGQLFEIRLVDTITDLEVGRVSMNSIQTVDFMIQVPGLEIGEAYKVDYYADLNGNELYDMPPTDHAWRDIITDITGDTSLIFEHNTGFTDIMWPDIGIIENQKAGFIVYPNPFRHSIFVMNENTKVISIEMYNALGQRVNVYKNDLEDNTIEIGNLGKLPVGIYLLKLSDQNNSTIFRIVKN